MRHGFARRPVVEVGDFAVHRAVEADALLDEREAFGGVLHALHVFGVVIRHVGGHGEAHRAVVDAHTIAHLAAQQPVDGESTRLAVQVPQRHLDRAHGAAPRLERAAVADVEHDPLDLSWIGAEDVVAVHHDVRLDVRLEGLDRAIAADPLVGSDPHDRVVADHGALEIGDTHRPPAYRPPPYGLS